MRQELWGAENFWAQMHCTSTLLDKIASKRKSSMRSEQYLFQKSNGLLSLSYSQQENIDRFVGLMGMKYFRSMASLIIKDMYKFDFDDCSSVDNLSTLSLNAKLDKLSAISLMQHIFGVVNELFKKIIKRYGIYSDVFYITALAHDSGKCPVLKQTYGIDASLQHHKASSEYIKKIAIKAGNDILVTKHDQDLVNVICEVLEAHHSPDDEKMFHAAHSNEESKTMHIAVLEKLKEADSSQREIELEMLT
ncbi:hypothetical protein [Sulfurimonas sp.]